MPFKEEREGWRWELEGSLPMNMEVLEGNKEYQDWLYYLAWRTYLRTKGQYNSDDQVYRQVFPECHTDLLMYRQNWRMERRERKGEGEKERKMNEYIWPRGMRLIKWNKEGEDVDTPSLTLAPAALCNVYMFNKFAPLLLSLSLGHLGSSDP